MATFYIKISFIVFFIVIKLKFLGETMQFNQFVLSLVPVVHILLSWMNPG